jgi:hypothetical protein
MSDAVVDMDLATSCFLTGLDNMNEADFVSNTRRAVAVNPDCIPSLLKLEKVSNTTPQGPTILRRLSDEE